ncbi:hypothetical protein BHM03_00061358 [Ensete ventricosum]|nr:hypothetical protein BHM03_00061358 [Ensete ventricosum]
MLQRAHQYMAAETLIAGKQEETKRPRGEQSRGSPKRREDSDVTKEGTVAFTGSTDMTPRNAATCSTKLKTSSDAATYADMSANNPPSLTADPLRLVTLTQRPDREANRRHLRRASLGR